MYQSEWVGLRKVTHIGDEGTNGMSWDVVPIELRPDVLVVRPNRFRLYQNVTHASWGRVNHLCATSTTKKSTIHLFIH